MVLDDIKLHMALPVIWQLKRPNRALSRVLESSSKLLCLGVGRYVLLCSEIALDVYMNFSISPVLDAI